MTDRDRDCPQPHAPPSCTATRSAQPITMTTNASIVTTAAKADSALDLAAAAAKPSAPTSVAAAAAPAADNDHAALDRDNDHDASSAHDPLVVAITSAAPPPPPPPRPAAPPDPPLTGVAHWHAQRARWLAPPPADATPAPTPTAAPRPKPVTLPKEAYLFAYHKLVHEGLPLVGDRRLPLPVLLELMVDGWRSEGLLPPANPDTMLPSSPTSSQFSGSCMAPRRNNEVVRAPPPSSVPARALDWLLHLGAVLVRGMATLSRPFSLSPQVIVGRSRTGREAAVRSELEVVGM
ncbi:hypothetical protein AMAG_16785 [Allomyces macrogynus ATCC 38327]|uniref:DUF4050 domain-containing protein n=1 Tax=Allomyces macrogynus (strain ATCC 38327) TaxID=578462 RepID=A0A0L0TC19_ALLM3|nr:hypothetical protein AMAG_16785 [Allomyces macrogynus ATCC 38327]|eukprot:KNE72297.1 hypothetical protein AMAG_16785 [Allomyces macrogynus ATCC 38327]